MRLILTALILALAVQAPFALGAREPGLRAVYSVTRTERNPAAGSGPKSSVENSMLTVRFTPVRLALGGNGTERIIDFTTGRITILDHVEHSSFGYPLYAEPAFRELELRNRAMLSKMMSALGQTADLVNAEAELGMAGEPPARLKLKEERRGEARVFVLNKQEMVGFVPDETELPDSLTGMLEKLYLFEAQIHPSVRVALVTPARLPVELTYGFRQFDSETTVTWKLRELSLEDMDLAAAAHEYPDGPVREHAVLKAAWRVRSGQTGPPPTAQDYAARIERLMAESRGFEGFLVGLEAAFALRGVPQPLLNQSRQLAGADPRLSAFLRSMEIEASHGDAEGALATLGALDADSVEGGAAVHVQRGNQHVRLGDGDKALEEFGHALAANPFLAGPLHDAGWIYYNGYAMPMAWSCWDAARVVASGDPSMKDVADMETALRRKHPEFFQAVP